MQGMEISKQYYEQVGRPMLEKHFPEYLPYLAAGLVGEGSECLGFDDAISRDHDFGPGFCIWLSEKDYRTVGDAMQQLYDSLPGDFMGVPARITTPGGDGRVGVFSIHRFYSRFIGPEQPPATLRRWLQMPEHFLAAATNGSVFEDNPGEFTGIREKLLAFYPEDVRIKKIAARAAVMAQAGQYNYPRCCRRGDPVSAQLAVTEFMRAAMSMVYLLNRRYAPYYKWTFRGLEQMHYLQEAIEPLRELALTTCDMSLLPEQKEHESNETAMRPFSDRRFDLIEHISSLVISELWRQGLTDVRDDFLLNHTSSIMSRIEDPEIRNCHVLEG